MSWRRGGKNALKQTLISADSLWVRQALALAGRIDEASAVCAQALKVLSGASIRSIHELGYASAIGSRMVHAARLLGLPE